MTTPTEAAAAPLEDYGFKFYPLTSGNLAELDVWMQDRERKRAIQTALDMELTGPMLREYLRTMHETASAMNAANAAGWQQIQSLDGGIKTLELASQGKCTADALRSTFTGSDEEIEAQYMAAVTSLLFRVRFLGTSVKLDEDDPDDEDDKGDAKDTPSPLKSPG